MTARASLISLALATAALLAGTLAASATCSCRFQGSEWKLGERACITLGNKSVMMECRMNQNVTSWAPLKGGCPKLSLASPIEDLELAAWGDSSPAPVKASAHSHVMHY
ncbi:hypothetical protein HDIA_4843 [Hartmannibacter diazotrophicus]|uniref:Integral membrane protein n=1 Tax=Hartmannibacter diazotrophicus TaxID=1482074 RepID=A0A2C9DDJ7_9HYPH|nr:hypothetical protein [Hartmannibacter diazotrophicus]SON58384.1 hypothetical protein HDIA_4843 [Hartmannibacter diazotrophicus]